jgi:hypothetical protein
MVTTIFRATELVKVIDRMFTNLHVVSCSDERCCIRQVAFDAADVAVPLEYPLQSHEPPIFS